MGYEVARRLVDLRPAASISPTVVATTRAVTARAVRAAHSPRVRTAHLSHRPPSGRRLPDAVLATVSCMAEFNEDLARRYFELKGLLGPVEHPYKLASPTGGAGWSDVDLCGVHPITGDSVAVGEGLAHRGHHPQLPARVAEPLPLHACGGDRRRPRSDRRPRVAPRVGRGPHRDQRPAARASPRAGGNLRRGAPREVQAGVVARVTGRRVPPGSRRSGADFYYCSCVRCT